MEEKEEKEANIPLLIVGFIILGIDFLLAPSLSGNAFLVCSLPGAAVALLILWIGAPKNPRFKV